MGNRHGASASSCNQTLAETSESEVQIDIDAESHLTGVQQEHVDQKQGSDVSKIQSETPTKEYQIDKESVSKGTLPDGNYLGGRINTISSKAMDASQEKQTSFKSQNTCNNDDRNNVTTTTSIARLPDKTAQRPGKLSVGSDAKVTGLHLTTSVCVTGSVGDSKQVVVVANGCSSGVKKHAVPDTDVTDASKADEKIENMFLENLRKLDQKNSDWTAGLAKISKAILCESSDKAHANVQLLIKFKFLDKFKEYLTGNGISSMRDMFREDSSKMKKNWPTLKRLYTIVWIACDQSVNFCQYLIASDVFQFFVENMKAFADSKFEVDDAKLFSVKACLGILHNISRHLPTRKWQMRNEGLVSATQPFLSSTIPIVRLKTLIILSYIISEAENEMINSNDDNFVFIFQVLSDSLKTHDRRSSKFGMSSVEVLKGLNNLAINDENKIRIVRNGALDLYKEILSSGTPEEIKLTITTLWSLSFHHYNKNKMREMTVIMESKCINRILHELSFNINIYEMSLGFVIKTRFMLFPDQVS